MPDVKYFVIHNQKLDSDNYCLFLSPYVLVQDVGGHLYVSFLLMGH